MANPWDDNFVEPQKKPEAPSTAPDQSISPGKIEIPPVDVFGAENTNKGTIDRNVGPWKEDYKAPPTPPPANITKFNEDATNNLTKYLSEQAQKAAEQAKPPEDGSPPKTVMPEPPKTEAKDFFDQVEAGFEMSIEGLMKRHALPTTVLPENADWFARTAAFGGETIGDLKVMLESGAIGGAIGGAVGGPVGMAIGAAAMGWGLPALMRQSLIQEYQKGSIHDFPDFWQRASGNLVAGMKAAAVGVGTEAAGLAGAGLKYVGGPLTGWLARYAAMTELGTAIDQHKLVPSRQNFLDSATAMIGIHVVHMGAKAATSGAENVAKKLGDIYAKTGMHPAKVALAAEADPSLKQDILSTNHDIPEALKNSVDPKVASPETTVVDATDRSNVLTSDNGRPQNVEVEKTLWHGSPHSFDKFTTDKIGTGEGAQAFGWGMYFADKKGIAESYMDAHAQGFRMPKFNPIDRANAIEGIKDLDNLGFDHPVQALMGIIENELNGKNWAKSWDIDPARDSKEKSAYDKIEKAVVASGIRELAPKLMMAGKEIDVPMDYGYKTMDQRILIKIHDEAMWLVKRGEKPTTDKVFDRVRADIKLNPPHAMESYTASEQKAAVDKLQADGMTIDSASAKSNSKIYQAGIKPPESSFLLYDKPLAEQSPEVQKILGHVVEVLGLEDDFNKGKRQMQNGLAGKSIDQGPTGRDIYDALVKQEGSPEKASRALNDLGIPGIKYLDATSRAKGSGSHNYVLFDDAHVEMRAKYDADGNLEHANVPIDHDKVPGAPGDIDAVAQGGGGGGDEPPKGGSLDNVSAPGEHPIDKQIVWGGGAGELKTGKFNNLFERVFDKYDPAKQARNALVEGGDKLKVINDPYWLLRLMNSADTKARQAIEGHGIRNFEGEKLGIPSLEKIVEPHKNDRLGFTRFIVAASNLERAEKGKATGFRIEGEGGLREIVREGKAKYDKSALQLGQLMNASLDKLVDAGVVTPEGAKAAKEKYKYYSPQYQETDGGAGSGQKGTTFKGIKGKEMGAKVLDPIEKAAQVIYARERIAAYNDAAKALGKLVEFKPPEEGEVVAQKIKAEGPDLIQPDEMDDPDAVNKFLTKKGEVTYFDRGVRVTLKTPENVARAFVGVGKPQQNMIVDALRPLANLERAGAIDSLTFLTRHIIRSEGQAPVLSQHGYLPVVGFMRGLFHTILKTDVFQDAEYMGALHNAVQTLDRNYLADSLFHLQAKTGFLDSEPNMLKSPAAVAKAALDIMASGVEKIANAPRVEEYRLAMKGKEATRENMLEAAKAGREVIPDASRIGNDAAVRAMSQITPFWNVHMQGSVRLAEALTKDTIPTLLKGGLMLTAPTMLLWYANRKDPDIAQTDNYTRDMTWQVVQHNWQEATDIQRRTWPEHLLRETPWGMEADNKTIYKIPKPFEPGVLFASLFERMADWIVKKDPRAFDGFDRTMAEALKMAPVPAALEPVAEQWANKSRLNGAPIVPHRLEGLLPKAQFTDYTSETAKQLGSLIGQIPVVGSLGPVNDQLSSPLVIQNYVRAWTGGVGQLAMAITDKALAAARVGHPDQKAAPSPADTPYVGSFKWRYPNLNARSIREFFDKSLENKRELDTFDYLIKNSQVLPGLETLLDSLQKGNASSLDEIKKTVTQMQEIATQLDLVPDNKMSKIEKRQLTDGLMYKSIVIAEKGNKAFAAFEAAMKNRGPELEALKRRIELMKEQGRRPMAEPPQGQQPLQAAPPQQQGQPPAAPAGPAPTQKKPQKIPSPGQAIGGNIIEDGLQKAERGY